jgi:hypothetical protein
MQTMQEEDQALLEERIRHFPLAQPPQTMREILQKERETTAGHMGYGAIVGGFAHKLLEEYEAPEITDSHNA